MRYRLTIDGQVKEVDIEPLDRPTEADRINERIGDQWHKIGEMDAQLGRVLMRLDAVERERSGS